MCDVILEKENDFRPDEDDEMNGTTICYTATIQIKQKNIMIR